MNPAASVICSADTGSSQVFLLLVYFVGKRANKFRLPQRTGVDGLVRNRCVNRRPRQLFLVLSALLGTNKNSPGCASSLALFCAESMPSLSKLRAISHNASPSDLVGYRSFGAVTALANWSRDEYVHAVANQLRCPRYTVSSYHNRREIIQLAVHILLFLSLYKIIGKF